MSRVASRGDGYFLYHIAIHKLSPPFLNNLLLPKIPTPLIAHTPFSLVVANTRYVGEVWALLA